MSILKDTPRFGRRRRGGILFSTVALSLGAVALLLLAGAAHGATPTLTAATVEHAGSTGDFTSVTMTDDGTNGDTTASDGVFGALVPIYEDDLPRYRFTYTLVAATEEEEEEDVGTTPTTLFINELMASNSTTILDPQGDADDWIELKNTGTTTIDLGGMYLSDKTTNPLKWQFPAGTTIAAGGYLLVWADDDDGDSPGLHTNFKLSAGGESVVLSDIDARDNAVIDSVDFPAQTTDVSYGRSPEGSGAFQALATASPGGATPLVPEIAIIADGPVTEGGTATFTVTATPAPLADVVVNVSVTQGADDDYLPDTLPASLTMAAQATEATLGVAIPDDSTDEPNGVLTVTITSGTGYTVSATAGSASLTVRDDDLNPAASAVVINELMASNGGTLLDPQGDADDWIELKNMAETEIDLSGMYLSDDRAEPRKWQFPTGTTIAADGYLLIWADADAGDSPGLHTNFKLSAGGESVVLSDTDDNGNTVIDAVDFPALDADESYGRMPEGTGGFQVLSVDSPAGPTPLVPEITILADGPVTEGDTATFTVTATPAPTADVVVNVAATQGAGDDYLSGTLPTSVTVPAQATEVTLGVAIPDDSADEPNGVLTATVTSGTGYTVSATAGSASLTLRDNDVNPAASAVVINELMASNSTILDPQGDADDWIELKNMAETEMDLSGMYLSDDRAEPKKWQFPTGTTIAAGGYLLVWADDDGGDSPGLHANFKLSASGESVVLSDTDDNGNTVIDAVDFPALDADESYGRTPEGSGAFQKLATASPAGPTPLAPLTAAFVGMPAEHNGRRLFSFELRFSDDFPGRLPYTLLRDRAFRVTNGTVRQARRVTPGQNQRWMIAVRPNSFEAVTVTLPAATDCGAAGAVCTEAGRPLSNSVSATVQGLAPLTAAFVGMPAAHDGSSLFRFELRFSDDFRGRLPYTLLRDRAFRVTNGTVRQAKRVAPGQNQRWMIAVRPNSYKAVTVTLPAATDCGAAGAVCTEAGRPLSNSVSATVVSAVEELTFLAGASRERRVEPHRSAGFPIGVPLAATGPEPLEWSIDDPAGLFEIDTETGQLRMAVDGEEVFELRDDGWFYYRGRKDVIHLSIVFNVTVTVSDAFDRTIETRVPIRVTSDTEGEVALSTYEPKVGTTITASVLDPDGVLPDSVRWQWEYDDGYWLEDSPGWFVPHWRAVGGATTNTFTPSADMTGYAFRVVVRYADGLSAPGEQDKHAESASTDEIK